MVTFDIETGSRVARSLRQAGFPVVAAFWLYDDLADDWRLVIASPRYDEKGPLEAYADANRILGPEESLNLMSDLSLMSPSADVVKMISAMVPPFPKTPGRRLRTHLVGPAVVPDAYVYNLEELAAAR